MGYISLSDANAVDDNAGIDGRSPQSSSFTKMPRYLTPSAKDRSGNTHNAHAVRTAKTFIPSPYLAKNFQSLMRPMSFPWRGV